MKKIKTLVIWILLFAFAVVVLLVFTPIAFIFGIIGKFWRSRIGVGLDEFSKDLENTTTVLDILGNVTIFNWLWFLFKKKNGYKFGSRKETISYVLWKNKNENTLTKFGMWLYSAIVFFDRKHFYGFEKIIAT